MPVVSAPPFSVCCVYKGGKNKIKKCQEAPRAEPWHGTVDLASLPGAGEGNLPVPLLLVITAPIPCRAVAHGCSALVFFRRNLSLVKELGDRAAQGRAYGNLGNTQYLLGNFSEAIAFHKEVGDTYSPPAVFLPPV